jgi:hypothetical protein
MSKTREGALLGFVYRYVLYPGLHGLDISVKRCSCNKNLEFDVSNLKEWAGSDNVSGVSTKRISSNSTRMSIWTQNFVIFVLIQGATSFLFR